MLSWQGALSLSRNCYPDDKATCLASAQIITDKVMQKLSAAAFYPKEYGEFANGYELKHVDEWKNDAFVAPFGFDDNDIERAKEIYNELLPEKVEIPELAGEERNELKNPISEDVPLKDIHIEK